MQINKKTTFLLATIFISLAIHILSIVASQYILIGWLFVHNPLHSAIEVTGSIIALLVAFLLYKQELRKEGTSFNICIASALVGMGIFDGLHALIHAGKTFVWLHSMATFFGGLLFCLIWLPIQTQKRAGFIIITLTFFLSLFIGGISLFFPSYLPSMINQNGSFSVSAKFLNLSGGFLLLLAAVRLVMQFVKERNNDDLLFFLHCVLFGLAAIMFESSRLWDVSWWGWHILRLLAYAVALYFAYQTQKKSHYYLKEIISNLEKKSNELIKTNKDLELFAFAAYHDLQEPLRKIISYCDVLQTKPFIKEDSEFQQYMNVVTKSALRLQILVKSLMTYSGLKKDTIVHEKIDLNSIMKAVTINFKTSIKETNTTIEYKNLPSVRGDKSLYTMLFQNLVSNSIKYQKTGSTPLIKVSCNDYSDFLEISISDNGIGIDKDQLDKIFVVFNRLHNKSRYEGAGIGLAICKKVVEITGGKLWAESELGKGSTFKFTIPSKYKA